MPASCGIKTKIPAHARALRRGDPVVQDVVEHLGVFELDRLAPRDLVQVFDVVASLELRPHPLADGTLFVALSGGAVGHASTRRRAVLRHRVRVHKHSRVGPSRGVEGPVSFQQLRRVWRAWHRKHPGREREAVLGLGNVSRQILQRRAQRVRQSPRKLPQRVFGFRDLRAHGVRVQVCEGGGAFNIVCFDPSWLYKLW